MHTFANFCWALVLISASTAPFVRAESLDDVRRPKRPIRPVVTAVAVAASGDYLASGGDDHHVRIWNLADGSPVHVLRGHRDWVQSVHFSSDGGQLFSTGHDGRIIRWDVIQGTGTTLHKQDKPNSCLILDKSQGELFCVGFDSPLRRLRLDGPGKERLLACPCRDMRTVVLSSDNKFLAAGGRNGKIRIWSLQDETLLYDLVAHEQRLRVLAFSPDGSHLISAGEDRAICIWDMNTGEEIRHLDASEGRILSGVMLDHHRLAIGTSANQIDVWDVDAGKRLGSLEGHSGSVAALACHGPWLISGGFDASVRIWQVPADGAPILARTLDSTPTDRVHR